MNGYERRYRWAAGLAAVAVAVAVGLVAYNAGLSHGLAGATSGSAAEWHGWHRHWGFGFAFPLFFFAIFWIALRGAWWGCGPWGRGGPWHYRGYAEGGGVPPAFDDWHRRAHERMEEAGPANDPGRRG